MADEADRADHIQELQRASALADVLERAPERALMIEGLECCRDCANPIPLARLRALPSAARCMECQEQHELKSRGYRR